MTNLSFLAEEQLEAVCGGGWLPMGGGSTTTTSWVYSAATYKNSLKQSNFATNLVLGGGKYSFAGITNEQSNLAFQAIAAWSGVGSVHRGKAQAFPFFTSIF